MVFDPANFTKSQFEYHLALLEEALAKDLQYPVKKKGKLRNVLSRVLFNAHNGYQQVQHLFRATPVEETDDVDYKALLYKYVASIYEAEGIDFIDYDSNLTEAENAALSKASVAVGQGPAEPVPSRSSPSSLKDFGGDKLLASAKAPSEGLAVDLAADPFHTIIDHLYGDDTLPRDYYVALQGDTAAFAGHGAETATLIPKGAVSGMRASIGFILSEGKNTDQPLEPGNYLVGTALGGYRSRVHLNVCDDGAVLLSVRPLAKA